MNQEEQLAAIAAIFHDMRQSEWATQLRIDELNQSVMRTEERLWQIIHLDRIKVALLTVNLAVFIIGAGAFWRHIAGY